MSAQRSVKPVPEGKMESLFTGRHENRRMCGHFPWKLLGLRKLYAWPNTFMQFLTATVSCLSLLLPFKENSETPNSKTVFEGFHLCNHY